MPESAAMPINRRDISDTNNGGDGNDSETIKRCRPGTYKTRWAGSARTSFYGGTTFMCVAAIACCGMPACANGQMSPCSNCDRVGPLLFAQLHDTMTVLVGRDVPSGTIISSSRPVFGLRRWSFSVLLCCYPFRDWSARRWSFSVLSSSVS